MQDAISLYDADERLVLANKALIERSEHFADLLKTGTKFEDVLRSFWEGHGGTGGR